MNRNEFLKSGLIAQYVMGLTSEEETAEVERMAALYPEIKAQITDLQGGVKKYCHDHTADLSSPDPHRSSALKSAMPKRALVMHKTSRWWQYAAVTACLLCVLTALYFSGQQRKTRLNMAALSVEIEALQAQYMALQASNQKLSTRVALLQDVQTRQVRLTGSPYAPEANVMVYWNPAKQDACLNVIHLPEPPAHHQFQVWAVIQGRHVNLGLLNPDLEDTMSPLPYMQGCSGFAITLEEEGGSETPTTDRLLAEGSL